MSNEEKPRRWNPFAAAPKMTEAEKRLQRIEELRRDLFRDTHTDRTQKQTKQSRTPAEYALDTLLAMLWVESETGRLAVACALADAPPQLGKAEAPAFAIRLCAHLHTEPADPLAIPSLALSSSLQSDSRREWAEKAVVTILNETLTTIKYLLHQTALITDEIVYRETDVCRDALRLGRHLQAPALVETTLRLLRLFTPDFARETGPLGRQTPELRALAAQLLMSLPPDDLYAFWVALGGSESAARRALLPVLDYLNDTRTIPYLLKLLERRGQWSDGELIGWACVRALQRFGDRRALPALRRLAGTNDAASTKEQGAAKSSVYSPAPVSAELARAARNAIEAIEHGRASPERHFLLRPSQANAGDLLLPTSDIPEDDTNAAELLRAEVEKPAKSQKLEKPQ